MDIDEKLNRENIYKIMFNLLKSRKYDEFIEMLNTQDDININVRDHNNLQFINYAILHNNKNIVTLLINKGSRLDVMDHDGRSILYYPIIYGYYDLLELLLHFNETVIGISLVDLNDKNGNIPLHYAIFSKKSKIINLVVKYTTRINYRNNEGKTPLHFAINTKNIDFIEILLKNNADPNITLLDGTTSLHMACKLKLLNAVKLLIKYGSEINSQNYNEEYSALHYSVINNQYDIFKFLLNNNADINSQDTYGNTILHLLFEKENIDFVKKLINDGFYKNIDFNIYNVWNKYSGHIYLENYKENFDDEDIMEIIINNTKINFQNNNSETIFYYFIKNNIWKKYKHLLVHKKLNIFVNVNGEYLYKYVDNTNFEEFIEMIIESYHILLKTKNDWDNEWEKVCSKHSTIDKEIIKKSKNPYFNNLNKKKNIECKNIIKKKIDYIMKNINKTSICDRKSYPYKSDTICIKNYNYKNVDYCTFIGLPIDIMFGMLYILNKYKKETCGIKFSLDEDNSYEILWMNHNIYFPKNLEKNFKTCKNRFLIIPLNIELKNYGHSNYIICDKLKKEVERFEPYGSSPPKIFDYKSDILDNIIENKFKSFDKNIKYISPKSYMKKLSFQTFSANDPEEYIGDPEGFCGLWSIWYVDNKLEYKSIDRNILVKKMFTTIKNSNTTFRKLIRNYSENITEYRDKILNSSNLSINDFKNDNVDDETIQKLFDKINKQFTNLL